MRVTGFGLDGAVVAGLFIPEPVVVVGHDVGEVQQAAELPDVVGRLSDLVDVAGQGGGQEKAFWLESFFQFLVSFSKEWNNALFKM